MPIPNTIRVMNLLLFDQQIHFSSRCFQTFFLGSNNPWFTWVIDFALPLITRVPQSVTFDTESGDKLILIWLDSEFFFLAPFCEIPALSVFHRIKSKFSAYFTSPFSYLYDRFVNARCDTRASLWRQIRISVDFSFKLLVHLRYKKNTPE